MSSLVSYGQLRPAFIGALGVIFSRLLKLPAPLVKLKRVDDVIEFSDSGIWGGESVDPSADFKVFRVSDYKGDFQLDFSSPPYRSIPEHQLDKFRLKRGDILVVKSSGSAKQVVSGRVAVFDEDTGQPYAASNFLLRLRPSTEIDPHYLAFALGSPPIRETIADSVKTMTYPNLSFKFYRALLIPLIPLADQRKVAQFLQAFLKRRALPDLPGYLREQRRIVARIEELAAKIEEARSLRNSSVTELKAMGAAAETALLGQDWPEYPLATLLSEDSQNGLSSRPSDSPPGAPILRISAATSRADATIEESDHKFLEVSKRDEAKYKLRAGDLLACRFNGNLHFVGRFALFKGMSTEPRLYPDKLIRFRVDTERMLPEFVPIAMNSRRGRALIEPMCATTAGNLGISAAKLKTLPIPAPPLSEQRRIVDHLHGIRAKMESLKNLQEKTSKELDALIPSILSKAFSGEL